MSGAFLVNIMEEGLKVTVKCVKGVPKGTSFKYSIPDAYYGIWLVIENESFPLLKDGDEIPIMDKPLFDTVYD